MYIICWKTNITDLRCQYCVLVRIYIPVQTSIHLLCLVFDSNSDELSMERQDYFLAFKEKAQDWYRDASFIKEYHNFFNEFFKIQKLKEIEWEDIQKIGDHLHSANSLAMAKKNAFGNRPNHDIEYYRNSLISLAHGEGTPAERLKRFSLDPDHKIKYFGDAIISELAAQIFPEVFVIYNSRSKTALSILGVEVERERGDKFIDEFLKFNEAIKPLVEEYKQVVGKQTDLPISFEIDQFLSFVYSNYSNDIEDEEEEATTSGYWTFAPGEYAKFLEDARKGVIHIGWDDLGDLNKYSSTKEIKEALGPNEKGGQQKQNAITCFDFANTLKLNDVIYLRNGRSHIIGKVIVTSDYYFDDKREFHKHCRNVKFVSDLDVKTKKKTALRTLAPLEDGSQLYQEIIGEKGEFSIDDEKSYFWLNANPKFWNIKEMKIGDSQWYTALNEKGKKRRLYDCFEKAQKGDLVIGYSTTPDKKAVCILEIEDSLRKENDKDVLYFKKIQDLDRPVDFIEMQNDVVIKDSVPISNNQGSLFPLTKNEFEAILELAELDDEIGTPDPYSFENLCEEIFLDDKFLGNLLKIFQRKKNIVLQGPPGVGKSYLAKRLAYTFMGSKDSDKVKFIQFHQSYSYEDFIQGLRPEEGKAQTFRLKNGLFYELSLEAIKNPNEKYVLIIDEINRGNLSKIFGELLYLIESDKRGEEHRINLTYSKSKDDQFYVPENLYIIGTMNTADRSLALVDYALRRRFSFFDIFPSFEKGGKFEKWLLEKKADKTIVDHILSAMRELNQSIAENIHELGPGFQIGHSYFQQVSKESIDNNWLNEIVDYDISPLLSEYFFNEPEKVEEELKKLKK